MHLKNNYMEDHIIQVNIEKTDTVFLVCYYPILKKISIIGCIDREELEDLDSDYALGCWRPKTNKP